MDSVTPISDKLEQISLTDEEKGQIRSYAANLEQARGSLADIQLQIMNLEARRAEAAARITFMNAEILGCAKQVALVHGIDLDDNTKGRWNLNTATMAFTRVA